MGRAAARDLLESSFAQFQADRAVAGLVQQIRRNEATARRVRRADDAATAATSTSTARCGASSPIGRPRSPAHGAQARRGAVAASLEALQVGDVIRVSRGRRAGLAVVLDPGSCTARTTIRDRSLLTEARWAGRLSLIDFPTPVERARQRSGSAATSITARRRTGATSRRRCVRSTHRARTPPPGRRRPSRTTRRSLGCGPRCELIRVIAARTGRSTPAGRERHARLARETRRACGSGSTAAPGRSDAPSTGSASSWTTAATWPRTRRRPPDVSSPASGPSPTWSSRSACAPACGTAWTLAELAAVVSTLVYEPRRDERPADRMPTAAVREALSTTVRIWADLSRRRGRARAASQPRTGARVRLGRLPVGPAGASRPGAHRRCGTRLPSCRRATSSGGASSCSTCSTRSPRRPRPLAPPRRSPTRLGVPPGRCATGWLRRVWRPERSVCTGVLLPYVASTGTTPTARCLWLTRRTQRVSTRRVPSRRAQHLRRGPLGLTRRSPARLRQLGPAPARTSSRPM